MIFVTVGAQMPFDRLTRTVEEWAARTGRDDVFAQTGRGQYTPTHIAHTPFIDPTEFRRRLFDASVVITHAGMGTILTALELETPVVVMPRRGSLKETRNDHQVGTARAFGESHGVTVAWTEDELGDWLDQLGDVPAPNRVASHASIGLLSQLRRFIEHGSVDTSSPQPALPPLAHPTNRAQSGNRRAA